VLVVIVLMTNPTSDSVVKITTGVLIELLLLDWAFHFGSVVRIMNLE
jgi:hypothetical protein